MGVFLVITSYIPCKEKITHLSVASKKIRGAIQNAALTYNDEIVDLRKASDYYRDYEPCHASFYKLIKYSLTAIPHLKLTLYEHEGNKGCIYLIETIMEYGLWLKQNRISVEILHDDYAELVLVMIL